MNEIIWKNKARKQLKRIAKTRRRQIAIAVRSLSSMPNCRNVKKLRGRNDYRLRVGDYRVIFEYDNGIKIVFIEEVKKRDERTY